MEKDTPQLAKLTLRILDENLRTEYLKEKQKKVFNTALCILTFRTLFFGSVVIRILLKDTSWASYIGVDDDDHDQSEDLTQYYIWLTVGYIFQIIITLLVRFLRPGRFLEWAMPIFLVFSYTYLNTSSKVTGHVLMVT